MMLSTPSRLSERDLAELTSTLPAWSLERDRRALHRRLKLSSFGEAIGAMVRIGIEAEKADHHPEWSNVYDTIDIWLTTHDADGVSHRDTNLANVIDRMFPPLDV